MDDFVNIVNRYWDASDAVTLASFALWKLNWIYPLVNGKGRTARITVHYILCLKSGGLLPGTSLLPEVLRRYRHEENDPYVAALRDVDKSWAKGALDLSRLHKLVSDLLEEQLASAEPETNDNDAEAPKD
jgi:Fic family protein